MFSIWVRSPARSVSTCDCGGVAFEMLLGGVWGSLEGVRIGAADE